MSTTEQPPIAGQTADDYKEALRRLVEKCEEHTTYAEPQPGFDAYDVYVPLRGYFFDEVFHRREKRTATEEYRSALKALVATCDEYAEVAHQDFRHLGLDPFESFEREVKWARRVLDRDMSDCAPDDDTNPVIKREVPTPDPSAAPINKLGVRQGDWVSRGSRPPVQILTGVDDRGYVRVSDPRDGTADWGGMHMNPEQIGGESYPIVPAPTVGHNQAGPTTEETR